MAPPLVDHYYLPTIEYVAGSFHALAPLPPPPTTSVPMQSPMPAAVTSTVFSTAFVKQDGFETTTMPFTIYGYPSATSHSEFSDPQNGQSESLSRFFNWFSRNISEAAEATLLCLRRLLDNSTYQVAIFTAVFLSYKLLNHRSENTIKTATAMHQEEMTGIREEHSLLDAAKDLEISLLKAQQQSQQLREQHLLEEARKDVEARNSAEERFKKELAELSSEVKGRDNQLATRDVEVAKATKRAETAENSNTILEKKAKTSRSDFDSLLRKKENEIEKLKRASREAVKEDGDAHRELKEAKAQAGKDRKKVTELEKQVTESKKETADLEAQLEEKEAALGRKDKVLKERAEAKTQYSKQIDDLRARLLEANNLRRSAEEKASKQEALAATAVDDKNVAEAMAAEQRTFAAEAWQQVKASEQEALAAGAGKAGPSSEALERQRAAEDQVEALRGEIATLLEQNNALRATLGLDKESPKAGSQEGDGDGEGEAETEDVVADLAPLAPRSDADKPPPSTRPRVRCNRRRDGSIRTAKHPLATPPKQQQQQPGVEDQRPAVDEQGALDGGQRASSTSTKEGQEEVVVGSSGAKRVRRVCPYFALGTCRFGDRCFDAHVA